MYRIAVLSLGLVLPLAAQHEDEKPKHPFVGDPAAIEA
jgi:hypothetical protein